jgi:mRNA interferase RelE/StbE
VYELLLTSTAERDLKKLDEQTRVRIIKKLKESLVNPLKSAKRLVGTGMVLYRIRIGDYRVIFELDGLKMVVHRIGHRREIYR